MAWGLTAILILLLAIIVWSLPLYITVKLLGGRTSILKALGVNILIAIIVLAINAFLNFWTGIVIFILTILVYRELFKLKWWKAFVVWLIQGIIGTIVYTVLVLLGVTMLLL